MLYDAAAAVVEVVREVGNPSVSDLRALEARFDRTSRSIRTAGRDTARYVVARGIRARARTTAAPLPPLEPEPVAVAPVAPVAPQPATQDAAPATQDAVEATGPRTYEGWVDAVGNALQAAQQAAAAVVAAEYYEDAHPYHLRGNQAMARLTTLLSGRAGFVPEAAAVGGFYREYGTVVRQIQRDLAECPGKPRR